MNTKRTIAMFFMLIIGAAHARADLVRERWAGPRATAVHAGKMTVERGDSELRLAFDLSNLSAEASVHRASLYCWQVTGVRAIHHDGQTFVIWNELSAFRPPEDSVFWVDKFSSRKENNETASGPGRGFLDQPRLPAISLATLRQLQGLAAESVGRGVRIYRVREVPAIRYRVYRHGKPITSANLMEAEFLGEAAPLCGLDEKIRRISYRGEFLNQQEPPDSIIPTHCYEDAAPLMPGEAYYAVTAAFAGSENTRISEANGVSLRSRDLPSASPRTE